MTFEPVTADAHDQPPASVDDYNRIGREIPEDDVAAVEAAALAWSPPED